MTPSQIIALVRDALIVAGLAFLVWRIYADGENKIKRQDLEAVQKQLTGNAKLVSQWTQEARDAETQRKADMLKIHAEIAAHSEPIIVRVRTAAPAVGASTVSANSFPAQGHPSPAGGTHAGCGERTQAVDLRPAIAALELKYETALADCRSALAQWPKPVSTP